LQIAPGADNGALKEDLERLAEAVDSHIYWQLSDPLYRRDAYVMEPGSKDPEVAAEIEHMTALMDRLRDEALQPSAARITHRGR
jgi:hypothetical protein